MRAVFECEQRLFGVQCIRRADVDDVDGLTSQQVVERVVRRDIPHLVRKQLGSRARAAANGHDRSTQVAHRRRMHPRDESGADDRAPELGHSPVAAFRNICVKTSMSSRAWAGGVRHSVPFTTQS